MSNLHAGGVRRDVAGQLLIRGASDGSSREEEGPPCRRHVVTWLGLLSILTLREKAVCNKDLTNVRTPCLLKLPEGHGPYKRV